MTDFPTAADLSGDDGAVKMPSQAARALMANLQRAENRIVDAVSAIDIKTAEVLALHLVVEREIDGALASLLRAPEHISRFGFGHKVSLLRALGGHPTIDQVGLAMLSLNEMRNAAAHADPKALAANHAKLKSQLLAAADRQEVVEAPDDLSFLVAALVSWLQIALYDLRQRSDERRA